MSVAISGVCLSGNSPACRFAHAAYLANERRAPANLHQEHAFAAGLAVEQLIGRLGLRELPAIREQMLDIDLVVGDEARAVGLDGRGKSPRADDGELLTQHLRADLDGHVA